VNTNEYPSLEPVEAGDDHSQTRTFRHALIHRVMGFGAIVAGIVIAVGSWFVGPFEVNAVLFGTTIAALGLYLSVQLSDTIHVSSSGIARRRILLGQSAIAWSDVASFRDGEQSMRIISQRGDEIRVSRHLPQFVSVLSAINQYAPVRERAASLPEISDASSFVVAWVGIVGILVFAVPLVAVGVVAFSERDWRIFAIWGAVLLAYGWRFPWIWLDIERDRFLLRGLVWKRAIAFADVAAIELANTQNENTDTIAQNQVVIVPRTGKPVYFAPRAGAIAVQLRARASVENWRLLQSENK
jgi:hypothetical protein